VSVATSPVSVARLGGRTIDRLLAHPRKVLGALIVGQIAATLVLGLSVEHNGWVWFQGGDQIVNTTTGWLAGQRILPPTEVSYVWPLFQTPITWVTGPTFLQAMPIIVLFQLLVLAPIALLCVYGVASHIGGRLLGYWAATLWVVTPFAVIPLFVDRYHEKWVEQFLPQALGLTAMPDFPSMVLVLLAALLVVRSVGDARLTDAALAGLVAGAAGGLKPPNYLFAVGAVLAYLVARRWRGGALFVLALVPSVLVLTYWKEKGLGYLPAVAPDQVRIAASTALSVDLDRYLELDFDHWLRQMDHLREFFFSARVAQWAPIAGLVAVLRVRRWPLAALLAGWLGAFLVVKGFSPRADIQANTFWRLLMPAWPAYLLLFATIPLLVPTAARRLGERLSPPTSSPLRSRWIAMLAVVTVLVPAIATAAATPIEPPSPPALVQDLGTSTILTPVDESIEVETAADAAGGTVITWTVADDWRANVFYRLYRSVGDGPDTLCSTEQEVSWSCYLKAEIIGTTRELTFVDASPPAQATYRVGVGTNWADDPEQGDVFVVSPAVVVDR
jgi:hypothetical protein